MGKVEAEQTSGGNRMTAAEFASLLHAKSLRRGHWIARCPAHGDKRPSLSIAEGRKHPVVFKCMSQGCTQDEVLKAMGLTWKDLLGERPKMSRKLSARLRDEHALREWQKIEGLVIECAIYGAWRLTDRDIVHAQDIITRRISAIQNRLEPERAAIRERDAKTARFVKRWGWDKLWELFLATDEGKKANDEFCTTF
jgi:hypothetical protein